MAMILGRDENGNYAILDDDGKIGVYNAEGKLVTAEDSQKFMKKIGRPSKIVKGKLYSGLTKDEMARARFGGIAPKGERGINLGGFA